MTVKRCRTRAALCYTDLILSRGAVFIFNGFFITPLVFFMFTFMNPAKIIFAEKLSRLAQADIGELSKDDIKKLPKDKRAVLAWKMLFYCAAAFAAALLISLAFFYLGDANNVLQVFLCNLLNIIVGSLITSLITRTAKIYKRDLQKDA